MTSSPARSVRHPRRLVLAVILGMVVLAAIVALTFWPTPRSSSAELDRDAPITVLVTIDSFDPSAGVVKVSVQAAADTTDIPTGMVTVVTDIVDVDPIVLPDRNLAAPESGQILVDSAELVSYPWDSYPFGITVAAFAGDPLSDDTEPELIDALPINLEVVSTLGGFRTDATVSEAAQIVTADLELSRTWTTRLWATAMMVIFWMLAIAGLAVAVATLAGVVNFETRHLAWLTAMIFAFAAFRNTAPGSPPIGVFIDFAGFFWAVGIIVVAELALLWLYLFRRHDGTLDHGPEPGLDDESKPGLDDGAGPDTATAIEPPAISGPAGAPSR